MTTWGREEETYSFGFLSWIVDTTRRIFCPSSSSGARIDSVWDFFSLPENMLQIILLGNSIKYQICHYSILIIKKEYCGRHEDSCCRSGSMSRNMNNAPHRHIYTHIISSGKVLYPEVFFFLLLLLLWQTRFLFSGFGHVPLDIPACVPKKRESRSFIFRNYYYYYYYYYDYYICYVGGFVATVLSLWATQWICVCVCVSAPR
jgi:hypothetical protein